MFFSTFFVPNIPGLESIQRFTWGGGSLLPLNKDGVGSPDCMLEFLTTFLSLPPVHFMLRKMAKEKGGGLKAAFNVTRHFIYFYLEAWTELGN